MNHSKHCRPHKYLQEEEFVISLSRLEIEIGFRKYCLQRILCFVINYFMVVGYGDNNIYII